MGLSEKLGKLPESQRNSITPVANHHFPIFSPLFDVNFGLYHGILKLPTPKCRVFVVVFFMGASGGRRALCLWPSTGNGANTRGFNVSKIVNFSVALGDRSEKRCLAIGG